jgi:hypothetical protein
MKRKRFPEGQIIGILNEAEQTRNLHEVCRLHNFSEQMFCKVACAVRRHACLGSQAFEGTRA